MNCKPFAVLSLSSQKSKYQFFEENFLDIAGSSDRKELAELISEKASVRCSS